jgi:hypothetical protein
MGRSDRLHCGFKPSCGREIIKQKAQLLRHHSTRRLSNASLFPPRSPGSVNRITVQTSIKILFQSLERVRIKEKGHAGQGFVFLTKFETRRLQRTKCLERADILARSPRASFLDSPTFTIVLNAEKLYALAKASAVWLVRPLMASLNTVPVGGCKPKEVVKTER